MAHFEGRLASKGSLVKAGLSEFKNDFLTNPFSNGAVRWGAAAFIGFALTLTAAGAIDAAKNCGNGLIEDCAHDLTLTGATDGASFGAAIILDKAIKTPNVPFDPYEEYRNAEELTSGQSHPLNKKDRTE